MYRNDGTSQKRLYRIDWDGESKFYPSVIRNEDHRSTGNFVTHEIDDAQKAKVQNLVKLTYPHILHGYRV